MITYLDTSALLKQYVQEKWSTEVSHLIEQAEIIGTCIMTYPEMAFAITRSSRLGMISSNEAQKTWENFIIDREDLPKLNLSTQVIERAGALAWEYGLRGYDAVHLSSAMLWQNALNETIVMATFDRELWAVCKKGGIDVWPKDLFA